jgi:hypothetical protein
MAIANTTDVELTPDDVLERDDPVRYELVDGRLREREMSFFSSDFASQLTGLLY